MIQDNRLAGRIGNLARFRPWGIVLLYLALTGYFYSFSRYGFNVWDEGGFAYGTLRTLRGEQALVDFNPNGYLPGRYLYGALFFKLFGIDLASLRLAVLVLTPAMVLMGYGAARKIMPPGFALLAALALVSAPSMYYNRFFPFFSVLNLYLLLQALDRRRWKDWMFLGTGILVSGLFKFEVALYSLLISLAAALLLFLPWAREPSRPAPVGEPGGPRSTRLRWGLPLLWLGGGLAALIVYFLQHDLFGKVFHLVVEAHAAWGNPFPEVFPFFQVLEEVGLHGMVQRLLFYLPLWVYAGVGALLLFRGVRPGPKTVRDTLFPAVILAFGLAMYGLVIWRAGFDNLLRTLPPFYILFCYGLHLGREKLLRLPAFSRAGAPGGRPVPRWAVNVLAVALPFLFYYEMNVHHGFYAGSIGARWQETAPLQRDRIDVMTHPVEARWIAEVVRHIQTHTQKGDPILALPLNPIFYFLTDRPNPTPYDWVLPGMLEKNQEQELVRRLRSRPPKMIIYVDIAIDGQEERRLSNYAPHLFRYIRDHYGLKAQVGMFQILLPKNPPGA